MPLLRRAQLVGGGAVRIPGSARLREWVIANALLLALIFAALSTAGLIVQTIRIYGFRIDLPLLPAIGPKGLLAENAILAAANREFLAQRNAARAESDRIAKANTQDTEKADTYVTTNLAQERRGADAFIAAGGVRRCPAARTDPAAPGQGPGIDAAGGALPIVDDVPVVTVLPEDVRICTENTVKARAWRDWGLAIEANHSPAD